MNKLHAFLLAGVLALAGTTAMAQTFPGRPVQKANAKSMSSLQLLPEKASLGMPAVQAFTSADVQLKSATSITNGPRRVTQVITEAPEGTVKYYTRSGGTYSRNTGSAGAQQSGLVEIVFCDNNEVYILNPISSVTTASYIKGTLNGNQITFNLPQTLYNTGQGYNMELAWLDITPYVNGTVSSYYDSAIKADRTNTTAVFTIDGDQISLQGSSSTYVLAGVWDDDEMWYGCADYESVYTETTLEEEIVPPTGITPVTYYYTGTTVYSSEEHTFSQTVNIVKDGNDIYFQGLATADASRAILPNAWAKGTLSGNTVTIPMGQYMGLYSGNAIYLVGYTSGASDITFTYDAEAETFTLDCDMFVNGKPDEIYYYTYTEAGALISLDEPVEPEEPVYELVTVPDGVTIEDDWTIEATFNTSQGASSVNNATEVAFDGNDVYIKGIPYYFSDAWMKGTISGNTATFASGQFVGSDSYGNEFMVGYNGSAICDIVFSYDSDNKVFTLTTPYIAENQKTDELAMWGYYNAMTIYKGELVQPEVVEVPEGLETEIYTWTGNGVTFDDDNNAVYTPFNKQINIGFDGNDVYVQGLCTDLPEAWVKGELNGSTATFATGQYFGVDDRAAAYGYTFPHYFVGYGTNGIEDVVFNFDTNTRVFTTDTWIIDNEYENTLAYYLIFSENVWTPFVEQPGKPANPEITMVNLGGNYPNVYITIPTVDVDGNDMNVNKLYYRLYSDVEHEVALIPFEPELYPYCNFTETVYEIPYTLTDDYDIYRGGECVYLNQDAEFLASLNQIGVQSVYYGGMENPNGMKREPADNESEIVWYFIKDYAPTVRTIEGTVCDADNQPLAGVTVTAVAVTEDEPAGMRREPAETFTAVTGEDGTYSIEVPADGNYNLTFEKEGYKTQTVPEAEAENVIMELDITTGVADVNVADVVSVTYVNAAGIKSDKPFSGVNIVVKRMRDGSVSTTKMVK
ncbi:MAG: carboxypeptidase regulatory-like domain-containing protein [Muribaculaceae bacterium]|nr:carboxypeptidase regulatory-like domain-containing protein [Muribaculaceae bacterium]